MENVSAQCPIRTTLEMLGGKWRLLILDRVSKGIHRYGEIKRAIPEISEKMLTQELKILVESNLLDRQNFGEVPPRVEYTLTQQGERAALLIEPIARFGSEYLKTLSKAG